MKKLLLMMLLLLAALPVHAAGAGGMFGQGRTHFSLMAGTAYAFDNSYMLIGASASYYVLDGLGIGLAVENWSGADPAITKVSPFAQYVFALGTSVRPYIGGFYRHTTIAGSPSLNSVGGRAGIYIRSSPNSAIGIGLVQESYLDCNEATYRSCSSSYSEISIAFGF